MVQEVLPQDFATDDDRAALRQELLSDRRVKEVIKKQNADGTWSDNMLGTSPRKAAGISGAGTVSQYRRLLELGLPPTRRVFQLANRMLYRVLSRDPHPELLFEYAKAAGSEPAFGPWSRDLFREGATAALAQGGNDEDPRVRGAAHRVATAISKFLRSELADDPLIKQGNRVVLHPEAHPPTLYSLAIVAYMPNLQRERAGFVERLVQFVTDPPPKKTFVIPISSKNAKPTVHVLGDPLALESSGRPKDIPFALHWAELLARMGMLEASSSATRALSRLYNDCDDEGVWSPKNLRALPKSADSFTDFAFPLEYDTKTADGRKVDVTFRLALIAKLAGWELEYV